MTTPAYTLAGGATRPEFIDRGLTVLQPPDGGLASTAFTWWVPPGRPALEHDTCRQLVDLRTAGIQRTDVEREPWRAEAWTLPADLLGDLADRVTEAADTANRFWWRLDITDWHIEVKHYQPGNQHGEHVDTHPQSMTRKVQAVAQLSAPDDYRGGHLAARFCGQWFAAPRDRGTVVVFPGWIPHRVTPIDAGERWSLIVTGVGPAIR